MARVRRELGSRTDESRDEDTAAAAAQAELDQDLFRYDLAYRLQARVCAALPRCNHHRCRRLGRCRSLLKIARLRAARLAQVPQQADTAGKPSTKDPARKQTNH